MSEMINMNNHSPRGIREQLGVDQNILLAPKAPQPKINDTSILEVLTHLDIFSAEDCAKIIADNVDNVDSWVERTKDNLWLFDKMLALVMAANLRFQFEVDYFEGIQLVEHGIEDGCMHDWYMDLGQGHMGNRKLSIEVQLSAPDDYKGGDLLMDTNSQEDFVAPRDLGSVTVFPSFMKHRVTPVTKGTRYSLAVWASGTNRFR